MNIELYRKRIKGVDEYWIVWVKNIGFDEYWIVKVKNKGFDEYWMV